MQESQRLLFADSGMTQRMTFWGSRGIRFTAECFRGGSGTLVTSVPGRHPRLDSGEHLGSSTSPGTPGTEAMSSRGLK